MEAKLRFIGGDRHCPTVPARDLTQADLDHLGKRIRALTVHDLVRSGCYEVIPEAAEMPVMTTEDKPVLPDVQETQEEESGKTEVQETQEEESTGPDEPVVPEKTGNPLACPVEGCRFVARSKAGLAAHVSAKHSK